MISFIEKLEDPSFLFGADIMLAWGRIVSAAGYSGVVFEESQMSLSLNGFVLYCDGAPVPFDSAIVSEHLRANRETWIRLTFTLGDASVRFWTSDLTAEYVRLNADYTT